MSGYIDMHCHILPEVDDGAQSIEETVQMLRIAYREGIRCIIATPHHHPKRGMEHPERLRKKLTIVRREAKKIDEKFRVYLGSEIFFGQDVAEKLKSGRALSMNKRQCVLLEFSPTDSFSYIQQGIQSVQMAGYEVILAHAERYPCLLKDLDQIRYLWEMGTRIQVNAGSITGDSGRSAKKFVKQLLGEHMVHCVGTDAHGVDHRQPKMKKAAEYVERKYGEEYMRRIFFSNAKELLRKRRENESE